MTKVDNEMIAVMIVEYATCPATGEPYVVRQRAFVFTEEQYREFPAHGGSTDVGGEIVSKREEHVHPSLLHTPGEWLVMIAEERQMQALRALGRAVEDALVKIAQAMTDATLRQRAPSIGRPTDGTGIEVIGESRPAQHIPKPLPFMPVVYTLDFPTAYLQIRTTDPEGLMRIVGSIEQGIAGDSANR